MKPTAVTNCIRSENYVITFEVEEEKFPLFGKKYQLKFANDITSETHCLVHFASFIRLLVAVSNEELATPPKNFIMFCALHFVFRAQFAGILSSYGTNLVDPRGRLLARSFDILTSKLLQVCILYLYFTNLIQMSTPNSDPNLQDGNHIQEDHEWLGSSRRHQAPSSIDEERPEHTDANPGTGNIITTEYDKGILGPGPSDLRFSDLF
uniref:Uncharacterized protein n=1 Tax=Ananas comosus var. bracteatus TaxID=296719 RepID=A0A6V7P9B7_ANACO|nr:unnamed protein product [Ananas comosus var. bracteatus]